ncbi:O-methyltransferase-domain-containing protein [Usnea florida]
MGSISPPTTDIESLGHRIQTLAAEVQRARNNNSDDLDAQDQLGDALDDLRAEIVGPTAWPGAFFAFPEFAAMQVAFQREIFHNVPLKTGGSVHARDLAALVKMDEDILVRIMRCLATIKMFVEVDEKVFAHTPISAAQADEYHSVRAGGMLKDIFKASSSLGDAIETKTASAWEARFGMPMDEYLEKTSIPERDRRAKAMSAFSKAEREEVATLFPWQNFHKVVEIGGGAGELVATLAQHHAHLQTVNQDRPGVIANALDQLSKMPPKEAAAYSHVEFEAYDQFTPQPRTDADAFILHRCLHNNSDSDCIRILKAVVPGLANSGPSTRLLICEKLMPEWNASSVRHKSKLLRRDDILMMINGGGKERSLKEFEGLIKAADGRYELDRVYYGRNNSAVVSVKLAQQDLGSAQVTDTSLSNGLDQDSVDPAGVTGNHAGVVEELKDAHTTILAS